ncbi:MBL fold metallo-hydrolase [Pseudopedobacter beijingensis]|uniref:MBL fold metallo-hydrolase n=1 Tax=Pseudopedobacter beijingensis TaxID=1207056 RepID=A0ABW4IJ96_9SPHI
MKLHAIEAGYFKLDGGAMFGVVPKSIWNKNNPADENNLCNWATRCLLVEEQNRLILIDTGLGDKQDENFFKHYYRNGSDSLSSSLRKIGFHEKDITDVILTHLHFDHVGGSVIRNGNKLEPTFKNAIYWSNKKHWNWAIKPNAREKASFLKENILPLTENGQLKFIEEKDGISFSENIKIRFAYGHTEAMMLPQITFNEKTILYMADLIPSIGHIPIPYVMSYDVFPMKTMDEKTRILEEATKNEYVLFLEHDPKNECCTLKNTEKGIRLDKTFRLSEI